MKLNFKPLQRNDHSRRTANAANLCGLGACYRISAYPWAVSAEGLANPRHKPKTKATVTAGKKGKHSSPSPVEGRVGACPDRSKGPVQAELRSAVLVHLKAASDLLKLRRRNSLREGPHLVAGPNQAFVTILAGRIFVISQTFLGCHPVNESAAAEKTTPFREFGLGIVNAVSTLVGVV